MDMDSKIIIILETLINSLNVKSKNLKRESDEKLLSLNVINECKHHLDLATEQIKKELGYDNKKK